MEDVPFSYELPLIWQFSLVPFLKENEIKDLKKRIQNEDSKEMLEIHTKAIEDYERRLQG